MQNLDAHSFIEAIPLFRSLHIHETEAILARLHTVSVERGTAILERGVWHGQLYIIADGEVSVLLQDENYVVARLGKGECFGEMSLITGEPPNATVRAEQAVTLLSLAQSDFLALIGTCPTLLQNINTILSQRLTRANQHLAARQHAAELIWVSSLHSHNTFSEQRLTIHISAALAMRTYKRVLHLELCAYDAATGPRFATHQHQLRPSVYACIRDHSMVQRHRAPTLTDDEDDEDDKDDKYPMPAIAVLAESQQEEITPDTGIATMLTELATLYDFILLVITPETPQWVLALLQSSQEKAIKQEVVLVDAEMIGTEQLATFIRDNKDTSLHPHDLFVTRVPETPTIGLQDTYQQRIGRTVKRLLPMDNALLTRCWEEQVTLNKLAPEAALSKAVDFVARHIARQTIGIAFGGGGARGFAHLGVLDGLIEHGVPLDYIAACSSGIITPGMYLIGKSVAESEEIFMRIQGQIVQWNIPRTSLFSNKGLKHMLRELCGTRRFEDLTTPFAMVAVDLATRAGVVLDRGPLWQAGLASVSLPGIFPPVVVGEHILMDAGMHDPVPIRLVRKMGAHILLASELGGQEPPSLESATPWLVEAAGKTQQPSNSPHIVDLLLKTYDLAMATIGMHSIREADVVIRPKLHRVSLRQFSEGRKFVKAGREEVEQMIPQLQKYVPWVK